MLAVESVHAGLEMDNFTSDDAVEAARGLSRLEVACGRCRAPFTSRHPRWTKLSF